MCLIQLFNTCVGTIPVLGYNTQTSKTMFQKMNTTIKYQEHSVNQNNKNSFFFLYIFMITYKIGMIN